MYKVFDSVDELYREIEKDKNWTGADSAFYNRYPLRFVLFETFDDFNAFVQECGNHHVYIQGMDQWMSDDNDDQLMTYSQLAVRFEKYIKHLPANDYVIAPFSEITRFYDNEKKQEFYSLVKTIRLIPSPEDAQLEHQRIYVPIIGMQGKMSKFKYDPNIHVWECRSGTYIPKYQLILTRGETYGVQGLQHEYIVCRNIRQWAALWKVGNNVKRRIVCTSKSIFDNADHARPDNAFDYVICHNAFEFLTKGLGLEIGTSYASEDDMSFWEQLAKSIDITDFNFDQFINQRFNSFAFDNEKDFVQGWFESHDDFSRWLLKNYYLFKYRNQTYLNRVLANCQTQSTSELFSLLATQVFEESVNAKILGERLLMLKEACKHNVQITELAEQKVVEKLKDIAVDPERGVCQAMNYMSPLTLSERLLMTEWLGQGKIQRTDIRDLFPELYGYMGALNLNLSGDKLWMKTYFDEYRKSKIANTLTKAVIEMLESKNASSTTFELWYNNFKTVKTILHNRKDIDVYYWIDGLGVDWLPYIIYLIEGHKVDGVFLNEIYIGVAEMPTCTANNKVKLEELSTNDLEKIGDLDTYAHNSKSFPKSIIEELSIVKKAIESVLAQYNGKKIAFVSDHGISYLAQYGKGLNLAGIKSDHTGRCAVWENGLAPQDTSYFITEDRKTICSLSHNSLTSKTPMGKGAHGGVTPEEVLVPIIIVSNQKNASIYSASLIDDEISAVAPIVKYRIKGISSIDIPMLSYNGVDYIMHKVGNEIYESERLHLVGTSTQIILKINDFKQTNSLIIKTGVEEDDLFGGL